MMRRLLGAVLTALVLLPSAAFAQAALLQGGPWTPGHVPVFVGSGFGQPIVQDGGAASGGGPGVGLSELNVTSRAGNSATTPPYANSGSGPLATHGCFYDAPTTNATGYHYLCMDSNAQGGGLITYGAGGGASNLPFTMDINGVITQFPFSSSGVVGPTSTNVGDLACWNNTVGTLIKDCPPIGTSGNAVPLLNGANTWSATQSIIPAVNSTSQALTVYQNLPSPATASGSLYLNTITMNYNGVLPSTSGNLMNLSGVQINLSTGASFQNQYAEAQTDAFSVGLTPSAGNTSLGDQVAISGGFYYPYSTLGRVYGIAAGGTCPTGCSAPQITGIESDISITGMGSTVARIAFNAVNQGTGQASSTTDTAFQIANGYGGSSGGAFKQGLLLQPNGIDGAGSLIRADYTGSLGNLIYMPNVTVSGWIINVPSFTVNGTGYMSASGTRFYGSTPNCSGLSGVCLGGVVDNTVADCGSLSGATGCYQIFINNVSHLIPFF